MTYDWRQKRRKVRFESGNRWKLSFYVHLSVRWVFPLNLLIVILQMILNQVHSNPVHRQFPIQPRSSENHLMAYSEIELRKSVISLADGHFCFKYRTLSLWILGSTVRVHGHKHDPVSFETCDKVTSLLLFATKEELKFDLVTCLFSRIDWRQSNSKKFYSQGQFHSFWCQKS